MVNVISFSLWGSDPTYNIGAVQNAKLALTLYPNFECWFYIHKPSVPINTINELLKLSNTKIFFRYGDLDKEKPMTWRFETIDDPIVEVNLSRDTDTRILLREKLAVDEWLKSEKIFHIMRDHPHHYNPLYPINAGMFGTKKIPDISSWTNILLTLNNTGRYTDQDFLRNYIYPKIITNCLVHTSFQIYINENSKRFPIPYCNKYYHVGGYVYHDESVSTEHVNILKYSLLANNNI
jgi:hypothetical protein